MSDGSVNEELPAGGVDITEAGITFDMSYWSMADMKSYRLRVYPVLHPQNLIDVVAYATYADMRCNVDMAVKVLRALGITSCVIDATRGFNRE